MFGRHRRTLPRLLLIIVLPVMTSYPGSTAVRITIPNSASEAHSKIRLTFYTSQLNWGQSLEACGVDNGHLVAFNDGHMYDVLQGFIEGEWESEWANAWVGLHWNQGSTLMWADPRCTISTIGAPYYKDRQEMVQEENKNCYQLDQSSKRLERKSCTEAKAFICQYYEASATATFDSSPFSMLVATPPIDCPSLCKEVSGCFIYHQYQGNRCILAVATAGSDPITSHVKESPPIQGILSHTTPSILSSPGGETPSACVPFDIAITGLTLKVPSDLNSPEIGVTCPTNPPIATETAELTTPIITTAEPAPPSSSPPTTPTTSTLTTASTASSASQPPSPPSTTSPPNIIPTTHGNASTAIQAIINELTVDVRSTSKFKAKLMSAYDPRKSSQYIGLAGILLLSFLGLSLLIFDIPTVVKNVRNYCPCRSARGRRRPRRRR